MARSLSGDQSKFDVYYGDGAKLHRQTFSIAGLAGTGGWTDLTSDHDDPSDIAFDLDLRSPSSLPPTGACIEPPIKEERGHSLAAGMAALTRYKSPR